MAKPAFDRLPGKQLRPERGEMLQLYSQPIDYDQITTKKYCVDARYFGLIPAAGSGMRLGAVTPKQYLLLAGKPMLMHAVRALLAAAEIEIVFVVGKQPLNDVAQQVALCLAVQC